MNINNVKYVPNTYYVDKVDGLGISYNDFLMLQVRYKQLFEKLIIGQLDFSEIEKKLQQYNYPIVNDREYNFYHHYSALNSKYIYIRNNIHIENLEKNEINDLMLGRVGIDFLQKTFKRVLYEEGDYILYYGSSDVNKVKCKSIVFELAVDYCEIKDIKLIFELDNIKEQFEDMIKTKLTPILKQLLNSSDLDISLLFYDAMPDMFLEDDVVLE